MAGLCRAASLTAGLPLAPQTPPASDKEKHDNVGRTSQPSDRLLSPLFLLSLFCCETNAEERFRLLIIVWSTDYSQDLGLKRLKTTDQGGLLPHC